MAVSGRSDGEEAFAQTFQFAPFVPSEDHEELRDFLYKFAHNYKEAEEYLKLLEQVDEIDFGSKSELLFRIQGMALQCFPLAMRRMTDNISKRSLQKLVTKVVRDEFKDEELQRIKDIHSHYKLFVDKGVAHQDEQSVKENLATFPDTPVIEEDMKHLKQLYLKLVKEICTSYIGLDGKPHDYDVELKKLLNLEKNSDDLIFKEIKRRLGIQDLSVKSIDTKAALTLSFIGAILAGLINADWFNELSFNYHLAILLPLGIACGFSLASLLVRRFDADPDPKNLVIHYQNKSEAATKGQLIKNYEKVFTENQPKIGQKAMLSKVAFVFLAISTLVLLYAILFSDNTSKGEDSWQTMRRRYQMMCLHQRNR